MTEVDERIARLQQLLRQPEGEAEAAVLRANLRLLRQLRAEVLVAVGN